MEEDNKKTENIDVKDSADKDINRKTVAKTDKSKNGYEKGRKEKSGRSRRQSSFNRSRKGGNRPRSDIESRVLSVRRVSRVVAGGRRFSLSIAVAVGNEKGKVGIGTGNGSDMTIATEKAKNKAQKHMIEVKMTKERGIPSESTGKYCSSVVHIRPSKGFVAGGAARTVAELAGIQYINAKIHSRSKNHLNNARAMIKAFQSMKG